VREQSVRRDLVRCGYEIVELGYNPPENKEELVMRHRWLGQILRQLKD
jgi:replicative DNA helicase